MDLFGTLDLSETNTYSINISSPVHISALYANNCTNLYRLAYISRNDISVIEATGGIPLSSCRIKTPVRTARLDIENYTSTFGFNMLGHGVISMNCDGDYISFLKVNGYTAEYYSNGVLLDKNYGGGINIYPDDGIYDVTVISAAMRTETERSPSAMHLPSCEQPSELLRSSATISAT